MDITFSAGSLEVAAFLEDVAAKRLALQEIGSHCHAEIVALQRAQAAFWTDWQNPLALTPIAIPPHVLH